MTPPTTEPLISAASVAKLKARVRRQLSGVPRGCDPLPAVMRAIAAWVAKENGR
jgi:hypothetical protein